MKTRQGILWCMIAFLGGCSTTALPPPGPDHPASPAAVEAPPPPASTALAGPAGAAEADDSPARNGHPMHHGGHR